VNRWPRDEAKLARVRALMGEQDLDALVVRAPDNLLYSTNYLCMKGYDVAVVPREGEATLIVLEPQLEDAAAMAWTGDIRAFGGYDAGDPRPPTFRSTEAAIAVLRERGLTGRVGLELSAGTQTADLMVGEPTVPTLAGMHAFDDVAGEVVDASPLFARARAIKTSQEIERMRLANDIAGAACRFVRDRVEEGMREAQVASLWEGFVHGEGVGWEGKVGMARGYTLVWAGPGIRTFTQTSNRPVVEGEPTLLEIWVCADGYWSDLTKNVLVGGLKPRYAELLDGLLGVYRAAVDHCRPGASLAELDVLVREGIAALGYAGQPSHPICHGVGARAHEPPYAHQAAGGTIEEGMVLAIEPGCYWPEGGGLRLEDNFLITAEGAEMLCGYPDDFRLA
jgi:Xaa-Pro aminopeptidase